MARHSAIADVGETLVALLRSHMGDLLTSEQEVALASPAGTETEPTPRVTVYLYKVEKNGDLQNREPRVMDHETVEPSPLALDLYYLLTALPPAGANDADATEQTKSQHLLLGRAMQVLAENATLAGPELRDSTPPETGLPPSLSEDLALRISVVPPSIEEVTNVWNTFPDTPYQPSVTYLVSPVEIDPSETEGVARVEEKREAYYAGIADPETDGPEATDGE